MNNTTTNAAEFAVLSDNGAGYVHKAANAAGTIHYYPIGNDRVLINGRDVDGGFYMDYTAATWRQEAVDAGLLAEAGLLRDAVDAHNRKTLDDARNASFDRQQADADRIAESLVGTRGTYADRNTY